MLGRRPPTCLLVPFSKFAIAKGRNGSVKKDEGEYVGVFTMQYEAKKSRRVSSDDDSTLENKKPRMNLRSQNKAAPGSTGTN
jgi:hypothetical protein